MTPTEINWDRIRSVDEVIAPTDYPTDPDTGRPPAGIQRLDRINHGTRVADRNGNRYLLMGYGAVQGTVILRDRYRRQFHATGDLLMRPC